MNLHGVVSPAIGMVNPFVPCVVRVSTGYTTAPDGTRQPGYAAPIAISAQVQPLSTRDLRHIDALNIQGVERAIYLNGHIDGLVRRDRKGGDLVAIEQGPNAGVYLVVTVLEAWPDWTKVGVAMQINGAPA